MHLTVSTETIPALKASAAALRSQLVAVKVAIEVRTLAFDIIALISKLVTTARDKLLASLSSSEDRFIRRHCKVCNS